ncbi:MAG: exodeoxyribonuclease V subunit beta, partial [Deltaproteobacteria bacterium]|nr:exodeoxyribonuclease V subunit beta [Deltaproteobacteria bacterium]
SAGTGKTHTIAGLFLRLILEKNLSVNEILVVTFTEAATDELKDRIRRKLREAVLAFSGGQSEDSLVNELVTRYQDSNTALDWLRDALRAFDQAAIFTIHGFCRRMLNENAFESGNLFDTELMTDQEELKREIVDDFWRKHLYHASPLFVNYAFDNGLRPDSLLSLLANRIAHPYMKIIPQVGIPDSSSQEKGFREYFKKLRKSWLSSRAPVEDILTTHESLNRSRYRKEKIPLWIQSMDQYVSVGDNDPMLFNGFEKFTSGELRGAIKKNYTSPAHPFFDICEKLKEKQGEMESVFQQRLLGMRVELFRYAKDELTRRKEERNVLSFDDLLLKLHLALEKKGGEELAESIRRRFGAALIDEFQDTDPIQYAIFKRIFSTPQSILFLIGDPKQAIYSFRGADIFAYMKAEGDVETRYTLGENWRSDPHLITAVNAIFENAESSFVYDEIPFQRATSASDRAPEPFLIHDQYDSPLQLWFLAAGRVTESGKKITKTQARELIPRAVAAEISRLLSLGKNGLAVLGERALREGDIAVLVRRNIEARLMQEALSALQIPSVLYSTGNLFDSHEALEVGRVLAGIVEPKSETLLKAALATDIMGVRGEELDALMRDEPGWERWLIRFMRYHDMWNEGGFIRMFRYLILREDVLTRLMGFPDGERRNTNLLHLMEVLHQISIEKKLSMTGLLKWLTEQRDATTPRLEEYQLRLESDENAVNLITIHKSKGLEYPVVFCPFTWDGSRIKGQKTVFTFHDKADDMRLTLDLGSQEINENRVLAEKEQLAENLRLLYVALTRAKSRCYLVWGRFNEAETSALAYLLHHPESFKDNDFLTATGEKFLRLNDKDVLTEINHIVEKADPTIRLSDMPLEEGEEYISPQRRKLTLTCRRFSGHIDRQWRVSSFSSLVSDKVHRAEMADRDVIRRVDGHDQRNFKDFVVEEEPSGIFSFPKGAKAGIFLHDLFENLDFMEKDRSETENLVAAKLEEHGFDPTWQETLCRMIRKVLSIPLDPENRHFTLSQIKNEDRLNELEFYFPLKRISPKSVKRVMTKYLHPESPRGFPERIGRLDFSPVRGFMKGFMDMVFRFEGRFYLVDWKSNFLGRRVEDYDRESLAAAMEEEFYILQYHLYTVALDQYLHVRLPGYNYDKHFGGVYYLFLRGIDPDKGVDFGVYRDKPSGELINELCSHLIDRS